jgi:hypothetical protein
VTRRPPLAAVAIGCLVVALAGMGVLVWRLESRMSTLEAERAAPVPPVPAPAPAVPAQVPGGNVQLLPGKATVEMAGVVFRVKPDKLHERAQKDASELRLSPAAAVRLDEVLGAAVLQFGEQQMRQKGAPYTLSPDEQPWHDLDVARALDGVGLTPAQRRRLMAMEPEIEAVIGATGPTSVRAQ